MTSSFIARHDHLPRSLQVASLREPLQNDPVFHWAELIIPSLRLPKYATKPINDNGHGAGFVTSGTLQIPDSDPDFDSSDEAQPTYHLLIRASKASVG